MKNIDKENLKLSRFNIQKEVKDKLLLFNTLTHGLLELDENNKEEFFKLQQKNGCNSDLIDNLSYGGMLINKNIDEVESVKMMNNISKFNEDVLLLTIAPTLECNLTCVYCYEKGRRFNQMNNQTIDNVINFVKNRIDKFSVLSVCWYGGEPLMALETIEKLTKAFKDICGEKIEYIAYMVSNGYLLTPEVAKRLSDLSIDYIQITLDGTKEIHDQRRFLPDNGGTFDTILNNIKNSCDLLRIVIRINLDKLNGDKSLDILDVLEDYELNNKVSFYIAQVDNINNTCSNNICLNDLEFSDIEVNFYKEASKRNMHKINFPRVTHSFCGAIILNSYVIDPLGDIYKCWNTIGDKSYCVGNVSKGIVINKQLTKWINYDQVGEDCINCAILPLCNGGCPYHYIKSGKHRCNSFKNNHNDIIKSFYNQQKEYCCRTSNK